MKLYETNDTKLVLESDSSSPFVFIVAAINVLGTGEERDITSEFCGESVFVQSAYKITANKLDSNQLYSSKFSGILT